MGGAVTKPFEIAGDLIGGAIDLSLAPVRAVRDVISPSIPTALTAAAPDAATIQRDIDRAVEEERKRLARARGTASTILSPIEEEIAEKQLGRTSILGG